MNTDWDADRTVTVRAPRLNTDWDMDPSINTPSAKVRTNWDLDRSVAVKTPTIRVTPDFDADLKAPTVRVNKTYDTDGHVTVKNPEFHVNSGYEGDVRAPNVRVEGGSGGILGTKEHLIKLPSLNLKPIEQGISKIGDTFNAKIKDPLMSIGTRQPEVSIREPTVSMSHREPTVYVRGDAPRAEMNVHAPGVSYSREPSSVKQSNKVGQEPILTLRQRELSAAGGDVSVKAPKGGILKASSDADKNGYKFTIG